MTTWPPLWAAWTLGPDCCARLTAWAEAHEDERDWPMLSVQERARLRFVRWLHERGRLADDVEAGDG